MAGRWNLRIGSSPNQSYVGTNMVYVCAEDFSATDCIKFPFLRIGTNAYRYEGNKTIERGMVGLNAVQRKSSGVSASVPVECVGLEKVVTAESISFEISPVVKGKAPQGGVDAAELEKILFIVFDKQPFRQGQEFVVDYMGTNLILSVMAISPTAQEFAALTVNHSLVSFSKAPDSGIELKNMKSSTSSNVIFKSNFDFMSLGIGGLDQQFDKIFRRAFASRIFPHDVVEKLHIKHVKGILLYGPPGTGKTLIARQIGKLLNCKEPKIVNGPEVLSKYVGESEERVRKLFEDAENDQRAHGNESQIHLIIFDEIDAICKQRGTVRNGTGVNDSVVNQLLSKMDGVEALNNVLIIGMTNRKDMIDEALLRPGRFEVHIEIGLPDESGRVQIFAIHTSHLKKNNVLEEDVSLLHLAHVTKNYSGAEIEGLVKSAVAFAFHRQIDPNNLGKPIDASKLRVTRQDFEQALTEVKPAFGVSEEEISTFLGMGLLDYGPRFSRLRSVLATLTRQVASSDKTNLMSILLDGEPGSGKTAIAAHTAVQAEFPFVKIISPELMVGDSEAVKCSRIAKVFEDAYKSPLSIIVLDNIERLIEYVDIGPRFSNAVLQTILVLLGKKPPMDRKLLILGTTSYPTVLKPMEILDAFNVVVTVHTLSPDEILSFSQQVLSRYLKNAGSVDDLRPVLPSHIGVKKLLLVLDMVRARADDQGPDTQATPDLMQECFQACGCYSDSL